MEFCGDDLIFSLDESKALANILNHYILELDATEEPFEELELRNYWDRAANLNLATMMLWMGGADVTREKVARFINPLASEPVNDQGEDVGLTFAALQARCLELPGSRPALVKAFRWAGSHMVEGSVVIQNEVGAILNSGYEDNAIS